MTSLCRICYDDSGPENPLLNPCECKGSAGAIHKKCLTKWMRISAKKTCEICLAPYATPELEHEPLYVPRYKFMLNTALCFYISVLLYSWSILYDSRRFTGLGIFRNGIVSAMPFLLLLNVSILLTLLYPIFLKIRHKIRYIRHAVSVRRSLYIIATLGSIVATFWYPFVGSFVATHLLSQLYDVHCNIVATINANIDAG